MKRRDFVRYGTLAITALSASGSGFAFLPPNFYNDAVEFPKVLPFRKDKIPREIKEFIPGFLWIDAADFSNYGGWALDTQFVAFMGSSYLIAHGTSAPVDDAVTTVEISNPDKYRLWVRCRNWIPEHSPGKFKVQIGKKLSKTIFGSQKEPGWNWQDGGTFSLEKGTHDISLKDMTGLFSRCSSIILTRDLSYLPPEMEAFPVERAKLIGQPIISGDKGSYDVIVVGAGPAGCCAAIAAARMGVKTALVNDRPVVGGNSSDEIGVPIQGAAQSHPGKYMRESGIIEEAVRIGKVNDWLPNMSRAFQYLIDKEPNLKLFNDTRVTGVKMEGKEIKEINTMDTLQGDKGIIKGSYFVDATGDGWLGFFAGASFRLGREAQNEFNEPMAPESADNLTMSGSLLGPVNFYKSSMYFRSIEHSSPVSFKAPSWIYIFSEEWKQNRGKQLIPDYMKDKPVDYLRTGNWWLEHAGNVDDLWHPEEARDELIRIYFSFWNYLKNDWADRNLFTNYSLDYVPFMIGKRETRRLIGDIVVDQNDFQLPKRYFDVIGHTGWPLDIHSEEGIFDINSNMHRPDLDCKLKEIAGIPFRSLYSKNISNLLMSGRNISVTHIGLGTVRVGGQCCVTGQAAGTGAALAFNFKTSPRNLCLNMINVLQQTLLKHDQYIPEVKNLDSADFALKASIYASSYENDNTPQNIINGWTRPLGGAKNMWKSDSKKSLPQFIQLEFKESVQCNTIQCIFDTNMDPNAKGSVPYPPECVKAYKLECLVNEEWKEVARVDGNFQRFRKHQFPEVTADAIRLTVTETNGSKSAHVFEIRVYNNV